MSTTIAKPPPPMVDYLCPVCAERNMRRILVRAARGSVVEVYCRSCKLRRVVRIP